MRRRRHKRRGRARPRRGRAHGANDTTWHQCLNGGICGRAASNVRIDRPNQGDDGPEVPAKIWPRKHRQKEEGDEGSVPTWPCSVWAYPECSCGERRVAWESPAHIPQPQRHIGEEDGDGARRGARRSSPRQTCRVLHRFHQSFGWSSAVHRLCTYVRTYPSPFVRGGGRRPNFPPRGLGGEPPISICEGGGGARR